MNKSSEVKLSDCEAVGYTISRYNNPKTIRGLKPVRMKMSGWVLHSVIEDYKDKPKQLALEMARHLCKDVTYRSIPSNFGTRSLEIWVRSV